MAFISTQLSNNPAALTRANNLLSNAFSGSSSHHRVSASRTGACLPLIHSTQTTLRSGRPTQTRLSMMAMPGFSNELPLYEAMGNMALNMLLWGYVTTRAMQISDKIDQKTENPAARMGGETLAAVAAIMLLSSASEGIGQVQRFQDPFNRYVEMDRRSAVAEQQAKLENIEIDSPISDKNLLSNLD